MNPLDTYLNALDLDDLLDARIKIQSLEPEEERRVEEILRDYSDPQAVANLIFHPRVIPEPLRFDAIDRALHLPDDDYLSLAATVGLQEIDPKTVPANYRSRWIDALLAKVRSGSKVLASRASVTIRGWLGPDDAGRLLCLYPVADETASNNILAFALSRFGELPRDEFAQALGGCGVSAEAMESFADFHAEYRLAKTLNETRALWISLALYSYIPNRSEYRVDLHD